MSFRRHRSHSIVVYVVFRWMANAKSTSFFISHNSQQKECVTFIHPILSFFAVTVTIEMIIWDDGKR
uniref:Secreted protein n=1 Tax=Panagrellus redivivus TaxID=6233 RepID=A0A7E4UY43_PANRE